MFAIPAFVKTLFTDHAHATVPLPGPLDVFVPQYATAASSILAASVLPVLATKPLHFTELLPPLVVGELGVGLATDAVVLIADNFGKVRFRS